MYRTSSRKITRSISHFLTSPNKVADRLNWKKNSGSLLSLFITKDQIDVALASHPEFQEKIVPIEPIALRCHTSGCKKVVDHNVFHELKNIIQSYNVCGMIVGWPVEKEGWCGVSCGRVLHTLDGIAATSNNNSILTETRPICLYDMNHYTPDEDEWGRSPVYCETTNQMEITVAHERTTLEWDNINKSSSPSARAVRLMKDFCKTYWPEHSMSPFAIDPTDRSSSSNFDHDEQDKSSFHSNHCNYRAA